LIIKARLPVGICVGGNAWRTAPKRLVAAFDQRQGD
jgi:hypothetical protein